jgi:tetratricopeptide (TPR) repeat protein
MLKDVLHKVMLLCFLLLAGEAWCQADYPWLRTGDELFQKGAYADSETAYRKAMELKVKPTTNYNLGNAVYHQERIPEAIQQFQKSIESTTDPELKSKAYYNLGNSHFQNKEFDKSIQAYRESLKLQPDDVEAKKNLMLAMRQYQQQQQQQDQKQDQSQEPKEQEQPSSQDQQESGDQDQSTPPQDKPQEAPQDVSKEEAREILKAIEREDQRVQDKLKKMAGKTTPPVKDW